MFGNFSVNKYSSVFVISLELEIAELEKSYQEQRKRLLGEVHGERLRQERENDVKLMEKQRALEQKFEKLIAEFQEKISRKEQEFQVIFQFNVPSLK